MTINIKFGVSTFIISIFPEPLFLREGAPLEPPLKVGGLNFSGMEEG